MEEDNYRVVTALTEKGLQEKVSKLRQEGWDTAGGLRLLVASGRRESNERKW